MKKTSARTCELSTISVSERQTSSLSKTHTAKETGDETGKLEEKPMKSKKIGENEMAVEQKRKKGK